MELKTFKTKKLLEKSKFCGCYRCLKIFDFNQIVKYLDENQTAVCPYCKIDAVLGARQAAKESFYKILVKKHVHSFCWAYSFQNKEYIWTPTNVYKKYIERKYDLYMFRYQKDHIDNE